MEAGIQVYLVKIKPLRLSEGQQKCEKKQDRAKVCPDVHCWKTSWKLLKNFFHGPY